MTAGLDPAARRVAWGLIRGVRDRGTTVVLVTHYMDEAEQLCDRVAVIDRGRVAAVDTPDGLINRFGGPIGLTFSTDRPDLAWLEQIPHVRQVTRKGQRVEVEGTGPVLALVAAELVNHGITPSDLRVRQPTLEDVFLTLTGREIVGGVEQ
jgi:ABC-2 type transport system ATP-binding protein